LPEHTSEISLSAMNDRDISRAAEVQRVRALLLAGAASPQGERVDARYFANLRLRAASGAKVRRND